MQITANTSIAEIVYKYPELVERLHQIGLYCFSWGGRPAWGSLALQARYFGFDNIEKIVSDLNEVIVKKRGSKASEDLNVVI